MDLMILARGDNATKNGRADDRLYIISKQLDWTSCADAQKSICHETKRAATNPELRTESSRWGASSVHILFFGELFLKNRWKMPYFLHRTVGCALSKALIRRSQVLLILRFIILAENCCLRKPSCWVCSKFDLDWNTKYCYGVLDTPKYPQSNTLRVLLLIRSRERYSSFFAKFARKIKLLSQWPKMTVHFAKLPSPWWQAYQLPCKFVSVRPFKCLPLRA